MIDYTLYAITDRTWLKDDQSLGDVVELAIKGGASIIQLREKYLTGEELKKTALEVFAVCKTYGVPFIVNDDVQLAKEIDADGVHVGQSDMELAHAREILGPDKIIGVTAKSLEQAKAAQENGATYLGSGAVFGSSTKKDAISMTLDQFQEICENVSIPVVAIGGIDENNIVLLKGRKMDGFAVISAIFARDDIEAAAKNLYSIAKSNLE